MSNRAALLLIAAPLCITAAAQDDPRELSEHKAKYYNVHTDVPADEIREVLTRLDAMAETYHDRTEHFAGAVTERMPFYYVRSRVTYRALGAPEGSGGFYDGAKLVAYAPRRAAAYNWVVIQHEGFHQFVDQVIRGRIPIWVNEGLAEYFGAAIFTGEHYITGAIPPDRLARIQRAIQTGRAMPLSGMRRLSHENWNDEVALGAAGDARINYDQAWSMVYFLAHGDDGRYEKAFNRYLRAVSRGADADKAWNRLFGKDDGAFERRWRDYWLEQTADATAALYDRAAVETLTILLAHAFAEDQEFDTAPEFLTAAYNGQLQLPQDLALPESVVKAARKRLSEMDGQWSLGKRGRLPTLVYERPDGTGITGEFRMRGRIVRPGSVRTTVRGK